MRDRCHRAHVVRQQRPEDQLIAIRQRLLCGQRSTGGSVIAGDADTFVLGIEQRHLRGIGKALADPGIGAAERHQQGNAVALRVGRDALFNHRLLRLHRAGDRGTLHRRGAARDDRLTPSQRHRPRNRRHAQKSFKADGPLPCRIPLCHDRS
ncbi:hypothetical protein D9M73_186180 [compost metagenome]